MCFPHVCRRIALAREDGGTPCFVVFIVFEMNETIIFVYPCVARVLRRVVEERFSGVDPAGEWPLAMGEGLGHWHSPGPTVSRAQVYRGRHVSSL